MGRHSTSTNFISERLGFRRATIALLIAAIATGLVGLTWNVLSAGGWTLPEVLILLCYIPSAPWLGLMAATGITGFILAVGTAEPTALVVPVLRRQIDCAPITAATVLCLCMRLEDPSMTFPAAERLITALRSGPYGDRFRLALLSDTPAGLCADKEADAARELIQRCGADAVFYRRRTANAGFKAGNLMEFLDCHNTSDFFLVLDADSEMSADAVQRMVRIMQADPHLAILQSGIADCHSHSVFAQLSGLGSRHRGRIWALAQAWWQGPEGPYWGHNALLRVVPFRTHCRLPLLPDGRPIMSHDHVEAALLHGAGWAVRVLPDDFGSAERHPPNLLVMLQRDRRWAAGNLQYRYLLGHRALGRLGRLQMVQAIAYYFLAPSWAAILPLVALNVSFAGGVGTSRVSLAMLVFFSFLAANLPKLAGFLAVAIRHVRYPGKGHAASVSEGGCISVNPATTTREIGKELLFSLLADPVTALDRAFTTLRLLCRVTATWDPQQRAAIGVSWSAAIRRLWPHTLLGVVCTACLAQGGWFTLIVASPVLTGLLAAVPFCVLTSRIGPASDLGHFPEP